MAEFQKVYTILFWDEEKDFIAESPEINNYELAEVIAQIVAEMSDEIAFYTIEEYFKKVY